MDKCGLSSFAFQSFQGLIGTQNKKNYVNFLLFFTAQCILANIADGDNAKFYIMANEDHLKIVTNYLTNTNTKLQMAAGKF